MRFLGTTLRVSAVLSATLSAVACSPPEGKQEPSGGADTDTITAPMPTGTDTAVVPTPTLTGPPMQIPTSATPAMNEGPVRPKFERFTCDPVDTPPYPRRLVRLTPKQYANILADAFVGGRRRGSDPIRETCPGEYDVMAPGQGQVCLPQNVRVPLQDVTKAKRFTTLSAGVAVSNYEFRLSMADTSATAAAFVDHFKNTGTCWASDRDTPNFGACVDSLLQDRGSILLGRPLSVDELAKFGGIAKENEAALGRDEALALAFQAVLMDPHFVFRPEIGLDLAPGVGRLTPYEVANALSMALTNRPPDQELWAAAASNALSTAEEIRAQITRILATPAGLGAREFLLEYFDVPHLLDVRKQRDQFLGCNEFQRARIVYEAGLLADDIFASSKSSGFLKEVLTSRVLFYDCSNQFAYNFSDAPSEWPEVPVSIRALAPADQRSGFLTHPGFLAGHAGFDDTKPVSRGRFVNESLLCRPVPSINLEAVPPLSTDRNMTMREKLSVHTKETCVGCHALLDPVGLVFEMYDEYGAYRTTQSEDNPKVIDPSGSITGAGDADGSFSNAIEMIQHLSNSNVVEQCFMRHGFKFFMGRDEDKFDQCTLAKAEQAYETGGGNFVEFLVTLFTSDSFLKRSY